MTFGFERPWWRLFRKMWCTLNYISMAFNWIDWLLFNSSISLIFITRSSFHIINHVGKEWHWDELFWLTHGKGKKRKYRVRKLHYWHFRTILTLWTLYKCDNYWIHCIYLISSDGRWGRKSLPTKKHINTQSSKLLWKKTQNIQNYAKYEIKYYLTYVYN